MLQQTQVATVIDYYQRFLQRFPTIADLAAADVTEVLKYWEGLGYYRRARQMQAAAVEVIERFQGTFPQNFDDVLSLPGIGRYTAGAICSFAYDQRQPILEANTIRLYCRLMKLREDPKSSASQQSLWRFAETLVPRKSPGEINQALMELGSLVCTPVHPKCEQCPLSSFCPTRLEGLQDLIPLPAKPKVFEHLHEVAWVVWDADKILLRQCLAGERWEGLWDFPRLAIDPEIKQRQDLWYDQLHQRFGLNVHGAALRLSLKHGVTKYKITLDCFDVLLKQGPLELAGPYRWLTVDQLHEVPLNSTARKIAQNIRGSLKFEV